MLHVIRSGKAPASDEVLRAMFAARKSVFVDLLRWDVPVVDGRYERDQYDDEHATYLVLADAGGRHLGSARLLRTDRPHILGSHYPELCAAGVFLSYYFGPVMSFLVCATHPHIRVNE